MFRFCPLPLFKNIYLFHLLWIACLISVNSILLFILCYLLRNHFAASKLISKFTTFDHYLLFSLNEYSTFYWLLNISISHSHIHCITYQGLPQSWSWSISFLIASMFFSQYFFLTPSFKKISSLFIFARIPCLIKLFCS